MTVTTMVKSFAPVPFETKTTDDATRRITGLAAAWSVDLGDDVIHKGAFAKTLELWTRKRRTIPLVDGHQSFGSVMNVVGKMEGAAETNDGLEAEFSLLIDDPQADAAYKRAKAGMITGLSIGYTPVRFDFKDEGEKRIRHLKEIILHEVSLVVFPMNPDAQIMRVKHDFGQLLAALTDEQKSELRALLGPASPDPDPVSPPSVQYATPAQIAKLKAVLGQLRFETAPLARLATNGETDHEHEYSGDRRQT
jgi:hypothetical protein